MLLVCHPMVSFDGPRLVFSSLSSCLFLSLYFIFSSLSLSFSLSPSLSPCVVGVVSCVVVCVRCGVWCETSPCVHSKRPRVCRHHAHMLKHMCAWCQYTRGRFERTHGDVLNGHTGSKRGHRQFCTPKFAHVRLSRATVFAVSRVELCVHVPCRAVRAHNINGKKGGGQTELPGLSSRRTARPVAGTMGLDTSDRQRSTSNKLTKK